MGCHEVRVQRQTKPWIYNLCIIVYGKWYMVYGIWGCVWSRGAEDTVPVSKAVMRSVECKPVTVVIIFHLSRVSLLHVSRHYLWYIMKVIIQIVGIWSLEGRIFHLSIGTSITLQNWSIMNIPQYLCEHVMDVICLWTQELAMFLSLMQCIPPHTLISDHTCTCNILYLSIDCTVHGLCSSLLSTH